jgi:hypothetical protein
MQLTEYKSVCRNLRLSNKVVANHLGKTRETVTLWFNGKQVPPVAYRHVKQELDVLIEVRKAELKKQSRSDANCKG